jgi:putative endonuclease
MFYVYIIKSRKTNEIYIVLTNNLKRRIEKHNQGNSFSTKSKAPWAIVYFEAYKSEKDAILREKGLKYFGKALSQLKRRIENSLLM